MSHETVHLGVAELSVNHNLGVRVFGVDVSGVDSTLQLEHHGACGVDNFNTVVAGNGIRFGWLAVGAQQHFHVVEFAQVVVGYCHEAFVLQTLHLIAVVHNIAQTIEMSALVELSLGFLYGSHHTETESRIFVNLYRCHEEGVIGL